MAATNLTDDEALMAMQQAYDSYFATRSHRPPKHPSTLLKDLMSAQDISPEELSQKTEIGVDVISKLLSGDAFFSDDIIRRLNHWVGRGANLLRDLQEAYSYFEHHGERRRAAPVGTSRVEIRAARRFLELKS